MSSKHWLLSSAIASLALLSFFATREISIISPNNSNNEAQEQTKQNFLSNTSVTTQTLISKKVHNLINEPISTSNHDGLSPIERIRQMTDKTALQKSVVKEYDHFRRYSPENKRIETSIEDPTTQRYAVDERTTFDQDKSFGMTLWSDKKYYVAGDEVQIFAYVQDSQGAKISGQFLARYLSTDHETLKTINLTDEDSDNIYEARISLTAENTQQHRTGIYKVIIEDQTHTITDAVTFTLSQPDIQLTGNYIDSITSEGDLLIEAEVEITQNNRFYVQASLYSSTSVPVGVSQATQQLSAGKHLVDLKFSGLMIRDAQESGPFVLKHISTAKVTMPMQRAPLNNPNYHTEAYGLDEFSSTPYQP